MRMDKRIDWRALRSRAVQRLALELASVACACSGEGHARPVTAMGLRFPSPVGIAAGFDRYGRLARRVAALGFGFNEIGSLTANEVAQLGVMHNGSARLGISLTLDARQASAESRAMLRAAWPHADYLMLNLIGPTSAPLLSQSTRLRHLLAALCEEQRQLTRTAGDACRYWPSCAACPNARPSLSPACLSSWASMACSPPTTPGHQRQQSATGPGRMPSGRLRPANRSKTCAGSAGPTWLCFRSAGSRPLIIYVPA